MNISGWWIFQDFVKDDFFWGKILLLFAIPKKIGGFKFHWFAQRVLLWSFRWKPRVWQTIFLSPVIFVQFFRKNGVLDIWSDVEIGDFLRNLEDLECISSSKFTRNPTFYLLFSRNLEGKSCNSLVWTRSSLDSALQRKNCSLNTQKQPLFWDKSNKNLTIRHLQTATKLDKMSSNWTQNIGLSHPGHSHFLGKTARGRNRVFLALGARISAMASTSGLKYCFQQENDCQPEMHHFLR